MAILRTGKATFVLNTVRTVSAVAAAVAVAALSACVTNPATYRVNGRDVEQSKSEAQAAFAAEVAEKELPKTLYDQGPRVLSNPFPEFPRSWQLAGVEGKVTLRITIDANGNVADPQVVGTARPDLAALCLSSVMQWRFKPAMKNGTPVPVRMNVPFNFELK